MERLTAMGCAGEPTPTDRGGAPTASATDAWDLADFVGMLPRRAGETLAHLNRAAPGYEAHLWPDAALILTGEREPWCNIGVVDRGPDPVGRLRAAVAAFNARGVPGALFVASEVADAVRPVARELRLWPGERTPWLVLRPSESEPVPPTAAPRDDGDVRSSAWRWGAGVDQPRSPFAGLAIDAVGDEAGLAGVRRVWRDGFGFAADALSRVIGPATLEGPGLTLFLARDGAEPISAVLTATGGDAVGLWNMATRRGYWGRGAGRALLDHVVAYHAARGATTFYLGATAAGRRLYEGAGFREVGHVATWTVQVPEGATG
jgi:GNAT superfamily N-acetyltransferase